jgi:hypothetical protein
VRRHEFRPGRLVAGLVVLAVGVTYALSAAEKGDIPFWAPFPAVVAGLFLAGGVGAPASSLRAGRRGRRRGGRP